MRKTIFTTAFLLIACAKHQATAWYAYYGRRSVGAEQGASNTQIDLNAIADASASGNVSEVTVDPVVPEPIETEIAAPPVEPESENNMGAYDQALTFGPNPTIYMPEEGYAQMEIESISEQSPTLSFPREADKEYTVTLREDLSEASWTTGEATASFNRSPAAANAWIEDFYTPTHHDLCKIVVALVPVYE